MKNLYKLIGITALVAVIGFSFTACDDGNGGTTGTAPTVTTATLPNGTVGTAYSQTLAAAGDAPITWSIDTGALPAGLSLSTAGVIAGTPETGGTSNFTVKATNATGSGTKALAIVIAPSSSPGKTLLSITAEYEPATAIFPDTTLDTLKEGLTVTAQYNDDTSAEVTDYMLSVEGGALIVGENTVTVTYTEGGITKSAGFTVTVNAAHVHNYGAWYTHTPATCTKAGEERQDCTANPPHYEDREIPIVPTAHDYQWKQTTAPTCSAAGVDSQVCTYNNSHIGDTRTGAAIDPNAHDYTWQETTAPTCSAKGVETEICTYNNSHTRGTREGADKDLVNGHDWNDTYTTIANATETTDGVEAITCKHDPSHTKDSRFNGEYATGTAGLDFVAINSNTAYSVHNRTTSDGTATGDIVIPAFHRADADSPYLPVTVIGYSNNSISYSAFGGTLSSNPNTTVTSVTFAEGCQLTTISNYAFLFCTSLTSISIPASVTYLGDGAIRQCTGLTSVTFETGSQLQTIGNWAFTNCTSLTSINIPASVTTIGVAFENCTSLANITLPESLTAIEDGTFSVCTSLTSITIPASVTSIGSGAFTPAFYQCTSLASVTFEGTIASDSFDTLSSHFPGDLRAKFYATDSANGTPGTYIVTSGTGDNKVWTKQ